MRSERISDQSVRVRATVSAGAWRAFEALLPRFAPMTDDALFELIVLAGLRYASDLADRDERVRAAAGAALDGVPAGTVVTGPVP